MRSRGLLRLCRSYTLLSSLCAFFVHRSCKSVRQNGERHDRANDARADRRNQKGNSLAHAIAGHGNNRQNEGRDKENEAEPKNPEREKAKNQAYPTGFDSRRFRSSPIRNFKLSRVSLRWRTHRDLSGELLVNETSPSEANSFL